MEEMNMKRILALVLVLILAVGLLAGCAKKEPAPAPTADVKLPAPVAAASDLEFENDSNAADVTAAKTQLKDVLPKVKVGFIFLHDENSTYDKNFINAAKEACQSLGVDLILRTNIPEGQECYDAAAELVDAGCNIIFADSFGHEQIGRASCRERV